MCRREEAVISALYSALDDIPVVGGSAGDGMNFEKTWMIRDGDDFPRRRPAAAVSHRPAVRAVQVRLFRADGAENGGHRRRYRIAHRARTQRRTGGGRICAHQVGLVESSLDASSFASHPVLVGVGGQYYARSIQKVNADGSLSFFCAIDEGLVLTVAKSLDPYESTLATFERMEAELGAVSLYIGFDCVLAPPRRRAPADRPSPVRPLPPPPRRRLQHLWRAISLDACQPDFYRHRAGLSAREAREAPATP